MNDNVFRYLGIKIGGEKELCHYADVINGLTQYADFIRHELYIKRFLQNPTNDIFISEVKISGRHNLYLGCSIDRTGNIDFGFYDKDSGVMTDPSGRHLRKMLNRSYAWEHIGHRLDCTVRNHLYPQGREEKIRQSSNFVCAWAERIRTDRLPNYHKIEDLHLEMESRNDNGKFCGTIPVKTPADLNEWAKQQKEPDVIEHLKFRDLNEDIAIATKRLNKDHGRTAVHSMTTGIRSSDRDEPTDPSDI